MFVWFEWCLLTIKWIKSTSLIIELMKMHSICDFCFSWWYIVCMRIRVCGQYSLLESILKCKIFKFTAKISSTSDYRNDNLPYGEGSNYTINMLVLWTFLYVRSRCYSSSVSAIKEFSSSAEAKVVGLPPCNCTKCFNTTDLMLGLQCNPVQEWAHHWETWRKRLMVDICFCF